MEHEFVTLVSGLPRSGTSMMMKMLEAGGLPVLADHLRGADEDNPEGYYEFERVKKIETDQAWLPEARGKVVKMISALLKHLPMVDLVPRDDPGRSARAQRVIASSAWRAVSSPGSLRRAASS